MKKIYFVLTYTGSWLSKLVRIYTKKEYSHVSLAFDRNLHGMYSFGRKFAYISFIGGFVHEGKNFGTFKRFKNTTSLILSTSVTDEQYKKLKELIKDFEAIKKKSKFNFIGLSLVPLKIKVNRKYAFYCAEFVKYMLDNANIDNNLPEIVKPLDFLHMDNIEVIYEGKLSEYKGSELIKA